MPVDLSHDVTRKIETAAIKRAKRIAMYDDWVQCAITVSWMPVAKHKPISDCKVFVSMQDGEVRPAYYEAGIGFIDGCGKCGGLLEPEYWTLSIQSPQDWIEDQPTEMEKV